MSPHALTLNASRFGRTVALFTVLAGSARLRAAETASPAPKIAIETAAKSGDEEEMKPRFEEALKLARSGNNEAAVRELLWCWDEGKKDPEFMRSLRGRVPSELARIGREYPAALDAMETRRNQVRERVLADKGGETAVKDLIDLNRALRADEDSLAVMDNLAPEDRRRTTLSIFLSHLLIEKKRYKEAVAARSVQIAVQSLERSFTMPNRMPNLPPQATESMRASSLRMAATAFEGYVGAGRDDDARLLAEKMLSLDGSTDTRELLTKHATRAGQPDWLAKLPAPAK